MPADIDDLDLDEEYDDLDEEEEERAPKKRATKKKAKPDGIGAGAVAEKLGANAKTFRAWLRRVVASGEHEELASLADREDRSRYVWANWKDPQLVFLMKLWATSDHTRGGGRKKKEEGEEEAPKKKPATRKRRTTKKS